MPLNEDSLVGLSRLFPDVWRCELEELRPYGLQRVTPRVSVEQDLDGSVEVFRSDHFERGTDRAMLQRGFGLFTR
ncbi:hypothetical protein AA309_17780 [Microvirga vignae]|uniref:Uncharacterized protein n=1 Tax=Microvirga vignae TaxID=1225564 RepID=A0A0H1RGX9_9HYPH|nr:hypothetical protein AA309_17780 [Microvirga vignae]